MNPRAIAALLLIQVVNKGRSLTDVLSTLPQQYPDLSETSFVKALCYEALRWYLQLQTLLDRLMDKPLKPKDDDIRLLMMVGLCQILYLDTPDHAAVTETVSAVKDLKRPWASKLVNAVLRNYLRQRDTLLKEIEQSSATLYSHPNWLIKILKKSHPSQWESILSANNAHPPLSLRVNLQKISRPDFLQQLTNADVEATASPFSDAGLTLKRPTDIKTLPGFDTGLFSVQDISPQLAPKLLDLQKGHDVLDACAAPGGKTMHILETEPALAKLVAIDVSEPRLQKAKETWQRLDLPNLIKWVVEDVENIHNWWDGELFDRILLDAPCSATGVIRRHPDIKFLRKRDDIVNLAAQQLRLLNALWQTLKPDGIVLYATCSVLPEENSDVVSQFLAQHQDAQEETIQANWGESSAVGRQILPGEDNMDGFYYAKLKKLTYDTR